MRTREEVIQDIKDKKQLIKDIEEKIDLLTIELYQISDDKYTYKEEEEEWYVYISNGRGRKKTKVPKKHMVGRRHWVERYCDEDNKENYVDVDRSEVVRLDGVWQL